MRKGLLLAVFVGMPCAASCVVSSFDVDPPSGAAGSDSTPGGAADGGKASGGKPSAGTTSGGATTGGTAGRPSAGAGTAGSATPPGDAGADGDTGSSGAAGAGNQPLSPFRVGFSEFHDSAGGNDNASASLTDATFSKPAGTLPGDFMFVFFGSDHSLENMAANQLALSGWKLQDQHTEIGKDGQATYLIYKTAGATEPESIVFAGINSPGNMNGVQGLLSVYRNVNATAPINAYKTSQFATGSSTLAEVDTATPAITTTVDNCLLIAGLSPDTAIDAPVIKTWPAGFDQDLVSVINPENPYPYGWANIYSGERRLAKAGTVPASAFTWDMTYGGMEYYGGTTFVIALSP